MTEQSPKATVQVRTVKKGDQAYISVPTKRGSQDMTLSEGLLSADLAGLLRTSPAALAGKEVEYEVANGQVKGVWEAGKPREAPPQRPAAAPARGTGGTGPGGSGRPGSGGSRDHNRPHGGGFQNRAQRPQGRADGQGGPSLNTGRQFENPYNFIPAPPRDPVHASLGDHAPSGHHRWHPDLWSGRISVELTTVTPLLIPDLGQEDAQHHKTFGLRLDERGAPYLPPTSLKGALRVPYEAITGSRMGVFAGHEERLALRHAARSGAGVVPVRVSDDGEHLELLNGTTPLNDHGEPEQGHPQCAAWVPCYGDSIKRLLHRGGEQVHHGYRVWARIQQWQHHRRKGPRGKEYWSPDFRFWRTLEVAQDSDQPPPDSPNVFPERPRPQPEEFNRPTFSTPIDDRTRWVRGWIVSNGNNITHKHDERLFFDGSNGTAPERIALTEAYKAAWGTLLASYREANEREIRQNRTCPTALPQQGNYVFSRHILEADLNSRNNRLDPGTLCYAALRPGQGGWSVSALFPVMISRDLYARSPQSLLGEHTEPATHPMELSPADRVFGWVNQNGNGSHKGQLRIGAVTCLDGRAAVERVGGNDGVVLAILGQPKPAQARFYAARTPKGEPLERGIDKKSAYDTGGGLRGRKVYPHQVQAEVAGYWDATTQRAERLGQQYQGREVYREWQRHDNGRDDQNRSITAWVRAGTRFSVDLEVTNLSAEELGALLWLLTLGDGMHLRLGGGKPLGFGSVHVQATGVDLSTGEAKAADYRAFGKTQEVARQRIRGLGDCQTPITAYKAALPVALGEPGTTFAQLPVIRAFENAARGGKLPVHYPRTAAQVGPSGESFQWFVQNEKKDNRREERYSLPALYNANPGLPELEET